MDDLLKNAIADAKAVRETALANARIALEEAFQPRIQSMLAKKIQAEVEGDDEEDFDSEEESDDEESFDDEELAVEPEEGEEEIEDIEVDDELGDDEEEFDAEEAPELEDDEEEEFDESDDMDADDEFGEEEAEDEDEDDLDLEAVIRELESEIDDEYEDDEEMDMDIGDDEEEDLDENDVSSEIGKSDNKQPGKANQTSGIGTAGKAKLKEEEDLEDEEEEDMDEDIDLQELLNQLTEEEAEENTTEQLETLQAELDEHREVVKYLRDKLNEVNLLNAKLLYTNKLFRSFELDNSKKFKVVETFDRAKNIREVKLVYSTLAESFGTRIDKKVKPKLEESKRQGKRRSSSSKPVSSTKPKNENILSEGQEVRNRFQKLANIK